MVRPERFELPTPWFVARYSIQLSYGRVDAGLYLKIPSGMAEREVAPAHPALRGIRTSLYSRILTLRVRTCSAPSSGKRVSENPLPEGWRRERDSNPRYAFGIYTLSRGAPSTTRPSLLKNEKRRQGYLPAREA